MNDELNIGQINAAEKIKSWFKDSLSQIFVLAGYAGTGKTYLINYIINNILRLKPEQVAFVTPTGKAASVLIQRGRDALTIHKLMYNPIETEYTTKVDEKIIKSKKIKFVKKSSIGNYKLIVIDEISMVEEKVLEDLLSYGIKILCSGDRQQLPAIGKSNTLLEKPDAELTEIVRQSSENSIVKVATEIRHEILPHFGSYGTDVLILNGSALSENQYKKLFLGCDQILCGKNVTRRKINSLVRQYKGIDIDKFKTPQNGEKIICNVNNWDIYLDDEGKYNLVNGTIAYASNYKNASSKCHLATIDINPDFLPNTTYKDLLIDSGIFYNDEFTYDMHQRAYKLEDGSYVLKEILKREKNEKIDDYMARIHESFKNKTNAVDEMQVEQIDFAYAISVHKSQGSEWNKVVVIDEGHAFGENYYRWLYTAATRAKQKLVIIR